MLNKTVLVLLILLLNACAIVPEREFSNYRYVFSQVRDVGEKVIIDYALAKKEQTQLKKNNTLQAPRKNTFSSHQLTISDLPVQDVAVRLRAWEVMATYNEALTQLIAGKSLKSKDQTVLKKLLHFSVSSLREAAAGLSPIAAALDAIVTQVEKGFKRHQIVASIKNISEIISSQLIVGMKKDSELFYKVRYSINNYHYQKLRVNITHHIKTFITLANEIEPLEQQKKVNPLVKTLNERLKQIAVSSSGRGFELIYLDLPETLKKPRKRRYRRNKYQRQKTMITKAIMTKVKSEKNRVVISQLTVLKTQILMLLDEAEQINIALEAYHDMLTAYIRLLNQMDLYLRVVQQAAISGQSERLELGNNFEIALIKMRQAFLYYQKTY
ncbi:MAG: hypothetical protein KAH08_06260 [Methylococcales bacterium]|nr:hypothetical protein [Methylococcales bacterium]